MGPRLRLLLAGLLATALLAGCSSDRADSAAPRESLLEDQGAASEGGGFDRTVRWAIGEPGAIVPPLATDPDALLVVSALFEGLTGLDAEGEPTARVAESWRSSDGARSWTFWLDPDAVFHDGTPVTAADVIGSWEEGIRQGAQPPHLRDVVGYEAFAAGEAEGLAGLLAHDDTTLQVLLSAPRGDFDAVVAHPSLAPVPTEAWDEDPEGFAAAPVGNGPFTLAEPWTPGSSLRLTSADEPSPRAPRELVFRVTDVATGYVAFQQGRVDIATVPRGALGDALSMFGDGLDETDGPGIVRDPTPAVYALGVDIEHPSYSDPRIRRALSFAIDRERLADEAFEGNAQPATSLASPAVPGASSGTCHACTHAAETAERLFDEAGVDELTLWFDRGGGHEEVAERLREDLEDVGVTLRLQERPFEELVELIEAGEVPLFRSGWLPDHPTLEDALAPLLHSRFADGSVETGNPGGYQDPDVDVLLDEGAAAGDGADRVNRHRDAERVGVGRDLAFVPLLVPRQRLAVGERINGFGLDPSGRPDFEAIRIDEAASGDPGER